jgi:hypothetical protein
MGGFASAFGMVHVSWGGSSGPGEGKPGWRNRPGYGVSGARIVLWKGFFEECGWALFAACEIGWNYNDIGAKAALA